MFLWFYFLLSSCFSETLELCVSWVTSDSLQKKWMFMNKQLSRGVFIKRYSENMQTIYGRTPMSNCDLHKVAMQLNWNLFWNHFSARMYLNRETGRYTQTHTHKYTHTQTNSYMFAGRICQKYGGNCGSGRGFGVDLESFFQASREWA